MGVGEMSELSRLRALNIWACALIVLFGAIARWELVDML